MKVNCGLDMDIPWFNAIAICRSSHFGYITYLTCNLKRNFDIIFESGYMPQNLYYIPYLDNKKILKACYSNTF